MFLRVLQSLFFIVLGAFGGIYALVSLESLFQSVQGSLATVPGFQGIMGQLAGGVIPLGFLLYLGVMGSLAFTYFLAEE